MCRKEESEVSSQANSRSSPLVADTLTPEPGVFSAASLRLPCPVPVFLRMSRIPASNDQRDKEVNLAFSLWKTLGLTTCL